MRGLSAHSRLSHIICSMLAALVTCIVALSFSAVASPAYASSSAPVTESGYVSPWNLLYRMLDQDTFVYEVNNNGEPIVRHPELILHRGFKQLVPGVDIKETQYTGDCCSVGTHYANTRFIADGFGVGIGFNILPKSPVMKSLKRSGKLLVAKWEVPQNMGAERYDSLYVQVSTSSTFTSSRTINKTIPGDTTEFTMSGMKRGKTYYFRVRGQVLVDNSGLGPMYAEGYDSKWSKVFKYRYR